MATTTPTPTPSVTPIFCGSGVTTGSYFYTDCCGNFIQGVPARRASDQMPVLKLIQTPEPQLQPSQFEQQVTDRSGNQVAVIASTQPVPQPAPVSKPIDLRLQFAQQAQARGISLVDAPMSGGPVRAREGQMSLMLAGDLSVLHAHQALLDAITVHRFLISETPGDAAKTKLANNLLAAINLAGASEVLAMAQSWGLDPQTTLNVMQASSGQSWIGHDRLTRALQNDFEPRAHTSLLTKDTRLALEACDWLEVSTPALGAMAAQQFAQACEQGFTEKDDASLFLFAGGKPKQD
jgi:hypothetical protein